MHHESRMDSRHSTIEITHPRIYTQPAAILSNSSGLCDEKLYSHKASNPERKPLKNNHEGQIRLVEYDRVGPSNTPLLAGTSIIL
jgi:hypothetical protein